MINRITINNNKLAGKKSMSIHRMVLGLGLMSVLQIAGAAERLILKQVDFVTLPGDEIEVKLGFDDTPPCECELPSLKKQLKTQEWLPQIEQYTVEWSALEVSELPSFYLQGHRRIVFSGLTVYGRLKWHLLII